MRIIWKKKTVTGGMTDEQITDRISTGTNIETETATRSWSKKEIYPNLQTVYFENGKYRVKLVTILWRNLHIYHAQPVLRIVFVN